MPFELENTEKEREENVDWLIAQEYKTEENQATEALFKWLFFSVPKVQKLFLSRICRVSPGAIPWRTLTLQAKGKSGVQDAVLLLADGTKLLFEAKIMKNSITRKQLKPHLKDDRLKPAYMLNYKLPRI